MQVSVKNNNIDKAIILLKRKLGKDKIFGDFRDRRDGVNKSGRERIKEGRAKTRRKKLTRRVSRGRGCVSGYKGT